MVEAVEPGQPGAAAGMDIGNPNDKSPVIARLRAVAIHGWQGREMDCRAALAMTGRQRRRSPIRHGVKAKRIEFVHIAFVDEPEAISLTDGATKINEKLSNQEQTMAVLLGQQADLARRFNYKVHQ